MYRLMFRMVSAPLISAVAIGRALADGHAEHAGELDGMADVDPGAAQIRPSGIEAVQPRTAQVRVAQHGLSEPGAFDGLGLRGNRSAPVVADGVEVSEDARLGADGSGLDIALTEVLPWFNSS